MSDVTRRNSLGFSIMTAFTLSQSRPVTGDDWKAFLEWANTMPPDEFPDSGPALLNGYRKKLIEDGMASAAADQVVARVREYVQNNPGPFSTLFYNKQYARRNPMYATGPNAFLVEDSHEPQLKVKDENLAPIQQVAILRLLGVKSVHFGGQSPRRRLTSQRGRRSELYLPESVYPFGQGRVTESDEVPID